MEIPKTINHRMAIALIALLVLFTIMWRLTPHMPNFAPVSAVALALSVSIGWRWSLVVTLLIMGVSDLMIGGYQGMEWTWLGFGLIVALGHGIKKLSLAWRISIGAIGASGIFFLVSNFGTWISSGMYSLDLAGLAQCYTMALPFLRATLLSDLVFTTFLLASYEAVTYYARVTPLHSPSAA